MLTTLSRYFWPILRLCIHIIIDQGENIKQHKLKNRDNILGFLCVQNMANVEAFLQSIILISHPKFLRSREYQISDKRALRLIWQRSLKDRPFAQQHPIMAFIRFVEFWKRTTEKNIAIPFTERKSLFLSRCAYTYVDTLLALSHELV